MDKEERADRESRCFEACSAGEKMFTHGDGRMLMAGTDICRRS